MRLCSKVNYRCVDINRQNKVKGFHMVHTGINKTIGIAQSGFLFTNRLGGRVTLNLRQRPLRNLHTY